MAYLTLGGWFNIRGKGLSVGSFPLTVTVTTMRYRSYKDPSNKAPLRTVTGRENDPDCQVPRLIDERSLKSMQSPASQSFVDKGILLLILKVLHDRSIL